MASMITLYRRNLLVNFSQNAKLFSVSSQHSKSFYESLGLTPKATQAEIKTAYYKLSKIYHPDRNEGSQEAATKFRDISEAYEVLGNLGLRKRYDRGILHRGNEETASSVTEEVDETYSKFYESRVYRRRAPTVSGRTPIYNFDAWAQAHYGASFARKQAAKKEYTKQSAQQEHLKRVQGQELFTFCLTVILITFFLGTFWDDYDEDKTLKQSTKNSKIFPEE